MYKANTLLFFSKKKRELVTCAPVNILGGVANDTLEGWVSIGYAIIRLGCCAEECERTREYTTRTTASTRNPCGRMRSNTQQGGWVARGFALFFHRWFAFVHLFDGHGPN